MSKELTRQVFNPFQKDRVAEHVSAGTIAVEQERAIAEAQGKLIIAKRFPRDQAKAFEMAMDACSRVSLAQVAIYKFPRGGQRVTGPSIRLAEELARCWGNIDYGIRELSRKDGVSEMEAYAWDLQTNTVSSQKFTVRHIRDKQDGNVSLTQERDIYEVTANMGARRLRARLLAILPPDLVDAAEQQCRAALAGNTSIPLADRVRAMLVEFVKFGVKENHISGYLKKSLDDILEDDLISLREIYNSINQGISAPSDWFGSEEDNAKSEKHSEMVKRRQQKAKAAQKATPQPEPNEPAPAESAGGQPVEENRDPNVAADECLRQMESAIEANDTDALNAAYKTGWNRMNELGKYHQDKGNKQLELDCAEFKKTIQKVYHDAVNGNN